MVTFGLCLLVRFGRVNVSQEKKKNNNILNRYLELTTKNDQTWKNKYKIFPPSEMNGSCFFHFYPHPFFALHWKKISMKIWISTSFFSLKLITGFGKWLMENNSIPISFVFSFCCCCRKKRFVLKWVLLEHFRFSLLLWLLCIYIFRVKS